MCHRDLHPYECDEATGRAIPEKMVKDYSRSAADQVRWLGSEFSYCFTWIAGCSNGT